MSTPLCRQLVRVLGQVPGILPPLEPKWSPTLPTAAGTASLHSALGNSPTPKAFENVVASATTGSG
jgi:hypothetical protein